MFSFPTYLEQGTLSRQHIVFYFAADLTDEYAKDFPAWNHMSPEVEETDCVTWIHMDDLADLLTCKTPDRTADALKISKYVISFLLPSLIVEGTKKRAL